MVDVGGKAREGDRLRHVEASASSAGRRPYKHACGGVPDSFGGSVLGAGHPHSLRAGIKRRSYERVRRGEPDHHRSRGRTSAAASGQDSWQVFVHGELSRIVKRHGMRR